MNTTDQVGGYSGLKGSRRPDQQYAQVLVDDNVPLWSPLPPNPLRSRDMDLPCFFCFFFFF